MPNYTFPARFEFLDEIRDLVAEVAREGGFSDKAIYSLQLAADEAASNIIEHAYEGVSDASIYLTCNMHEICDHHARSWESRSTRPVSKSQT
jgi:serine/threonine-protein kinase RsbW